MILATHTALTSRKQTPKPYPEHTVEIDTTTAPVTVTTAKYYDSENSAANARIETVPVTIAPALDQRQAITARQRSMSYISHDF